MICPVVNRCKEILALLQARLSLGVIRVAEAEAEVDGGETRLVRAKGGFDFLRLSEMDHRLLCVSHQLVAPAQVPVRAGDGRPEQLFSVNDL